MNKQEAIEVLQDMSKDTFENDHTEMVHIDDIVETINKIDETQKVVVPKFVAEWIDEIKEGGYSLYTAFDLVDGNIRTFDWLFNGCKTNQDTFARAWLDGYTVEQEKLYTVEIPNPNINARTVLQKTKKGLVLVTVGNTGWAKWESSKLTESEIKQDFEWAWQWAKEVE